MRIHSGVYLLMEASTPQEEGDFARIYSVRFDNSITRCLQFFYLIQVRILTKEYLLFVNSKYVLWYCRYCPGLIDLFV